MEKLKSPAAYLVLAKSTHLQTTVTVGDAVVLRRKPGRRVFPTGSQHWCRPMCNIRSWSHHRSRVGSSDAQQLDRCQRTLQQFGLLSSLEHPSRRTNSCCTVPWVL